MNIIKMHPSHVPVLKAVLKVYNPKTCIECGSGQFSTGILSKVEQFETIEHSEEWANHAAKAGLKVKHDPLPVKYNVYPAAMKKELRRKISGLYRGYAIDCDMVFIDSYAGVRDIALACFWGMFNVAVLHDTQKPGYGYQKVIERLATSGLVQIHCKPTNGDPWSDILFCPGYENAAGATKHLLPEIQSDKYPFKFIVKEWR